MISEELQKLRTTKAAIKLALIDKGLNPTDEFATYADDIANISGGGGDLDIKDGDARRYLTELIDNSNEYYGLVFTYRSGFSGIITKPILYLDSTFNVGSFSGEVLYSYLCNSNPTLAYATLNCTDEQLKTVSNLFYNCVSLKKCTINGLKNCSDFYSIFDGCTSLESVTLNNVEMSGRLYGLFYNCKNLKEININNCILSTTDAGRMLGLTDLRRLDDVINSIDFSNATTFTYFMYNNPSIYYIPEINTSNATTMTYMFLNCFDLRRVEGVSFKKQTSNPTNFYTGASYSYLTTTEIYALRYLLIKDLGWTNNNKAAAYTFNFNNANYQNWGKPTTPENDALWGNVNTLDARQSVVDTLLTYSCDRVAEGYTGKCTVQLHANTKALLTADEIAAITAKGYTIS